MNGIGGNTVAEVKNNLTMLEVQQWAEYRLRRGSLNIGRRVEQVCANMMAVHINSQKTNSNKRIHPIELMPHEDDVVISFEEQIAND